MATLCRYLPKGVVPADDASPVRTTIPVLWLTGDGDPQDPPANLTAVSTQEPNSRVVVMPAQEHVVGHLGCGPAVIAAFVDAGTANGLDTSCVAQGRPDSDLPASLRPATGAPPLIDDPVLRRREPPPLGEEPRDVPSVAGIAYTRPRADIAQR